MLHSATVWRRAASAGPSTGGPGTRPPPGRWLPSPQLSILTAALACAAIYEQTAIAPVLKKKVPPSAPPLAGESGPAW